jgi:hypothetical protein
MRGPVPRETARKPVRVGGTTIAHVRADLAPGPQGEA